MIRPMPRTPLLAAVARAFRVARRSDRSGVPPQELLERALEERRLSRRGFLTTTAGVGAALAAGSVLSVGAREAGGPDRRGSERRKFERTDSGRGDGPPVLVVGAGIAGLTASYRLMQAGVPVRVCEAQTRVGGRMWSLRDRFADGQVVELGGELIDTGHTHIRALADELEIRLDDLAQEDPELSETWWFGGRRRTTAEVVEAFRAVSPRIEASLATLGGDGWVTHAEPNGGERLDRQSIAEWLDGAEVDGWFRDLLDVAYTTEYGLEIDQQSALNLLLLIDPNPEPFRIFGDSDERFHVHEGNDAIPRELAARLGDRIELEQVLEAISRTPDGRYRCSFLSGRTSREILAEQVILTLPFSVLCKVRMDVELPLVQRRAIDDLGYGTNAKLMVGFSERVWRTRHGSDGSVVSDLPFQLTWETSRGQAGSAGVLTNFTGGKHGRRLGRGTAGSQADRLVGDLDRVFPGIAAARERMEQVRFHWPSFRWSRGSYACYRPGQWTAFGGEEGRAVDGLHFAGEHTSQDAQGYMEGGCESGERAAREVLEARGVRARRGSRTRAA